MYATVRYPGVMNVRAQMAWTFTMTMDAGNRIVITAPETFQLSCSTEGSMKAITLPGGMPDCEGDEGNTLGLVVNETLTRNVFAFVIEVTVPADTPLDNEFHIQILNWRLGVVDGAYGLPGVPVRPIGARSPSLSWTRSEPNQPTEVTVGLTFTQEVEWVRAILFQFPPTIIHDVQRPSEVKNLNRKFPLPSNTEYADTTSYAFLKVYTAETEGARMITADVYKWNFPVMLPSEMPRDNIWTIGLCEDRTCRTPEDPTVRAFFPMGGFKMGERSPEDLKDVEAHAFYTAIFALPLFFS
jgi:hypothetical protein